MARRFTVTFDAHDPGRLAEFWGIALDYELQPPPPGFDTWDDFADANNIPPERRDDISAVVDPDGVGPRLLFLRVPEGKTAKNRVHLDVHADIDRATAGKTEHLAAIRTMVDRLVAAGATEQASHDEVTVWTVLTDPEGNEFCVV